MIKSRRWWRRVALAFLAPYISYVPCGIVPRLVAARPNLRQGEGGLGCRLLIITHELIAAGLTGDVPVQDGCPFQRVRAARCDLASARGTGGCRK